MKWLWIIAWVFFTVLHVLALMGGNTSMAGVFLIVMWVLIVLIRIEAIGERHE